MDSVIVEGQHGNEGVSSANNLVGQLGLVHFAASLLFFHSSYLGLLSFWFMSDLDSFLGGAALDIVEGKLLFSKDNSSSLPLFEIKTVFLFIFINFMLYCFLFVERDTNLLSFRARFKTK